MVDAIRDEWKPLQQEFVKSAYEVASQAYKFVQEGEFQEATRLTTTYMDSNTKKVLNKVRQVLSQTTPTTLAASD
jgi:ribosomal protein S17E